MKRSSHPIQVPNGTWRKRSRGFSAIELMTVVAVVAILAALAAPSFRQLIATQRVKSVASALNESLWVARSEALKRNQDVAFVFPHAGAVTDWNITQSSDASVLVSQTGSPSVASETSTGANLLFVFNSSGRLTSGGSSWIKLSVPSASVARWVCVSAGGRATTQATSTCP